MAGYQAKKILVANRGEIAIRILTAATELGFETVAVFSDPQDTSHCDAAHISIRIRSAASFLDPKEIIEAAKSVNAYAIHPGYGFLSESAEFANQCQSQGILFIGPSPGCIKAVGDKISARQVAIAAHVPVIPGTEHSLSTPAEVYTFAERVGYPVMLKARDGGGGRGIRMCLGREDVEDALKRCINESPSKQVFSEKAIQGAKHIEVQVMGDRHGNVIHLFERDCSAQRRYQKVLEVAPCPSLNKDLAKEIHAAAIRICRHIKYDSVGTVEFLVHPDSNSFYFLEVNPRIQVEHTISEQITHVDIVQTQIKIALGQSLVQMGLNQDTIQPSRLVAIQARVVAENPMHNNMLSVGKITDLRFPTGHGIRVDTWVKSGATVIPTFDSLLAKVIVTGQSFDDALSKLDNALKNTVITGVNTNIDFLRALLSDADFFENSMSNVNIKSLENKMDVHLKITAVLSEERRLRLINEKTSTKVTAAPTSASSLQFKPGDAFNIETSDPNNKDTTSNIHTFQIDSISVNNFPDEFSAHVQSASSEAPGFPSNPFAMTITRKSAITSAGTKLRRKAVARTLTDVGCPVTGMLVEISVEEGDVVKEGQELFVVNAMKMETVIKSPIYGRVKHIYGKPSELVEGGDLVIELSEVKNSKL
ncbi:carbamoyl-phosphate synthase L chain, ATP binding domain-containing protein [Phycomyces blakesleeanus]|uniref:Carbamoyl-phosphate synthase L chain, ATP binding domain-containing protein n=2 Tax=Phycomyces blakesleeanus TaxID=4837 RepID=A0ABR3AXU9_PHYBL